MMDLIGDVLNGKNSSKTDLSAVCHRLALSEDMSFGAIVTSFSDRNIRQFLNFLEFLVVRGDR
jgi:hypothetical protein